MTTPFSPAPDPPPSGIFVHVSINAARKSGGTWGDTPYAEALVRAIRAVPGCDSALLFRGEVPASVQGPAVLLRLIGPHLEEPHEGMPNLVWMISPPLIQHLALLRRYQSVLCASPAMAGYLLNSGLQAGFLPQATDPALFNPSRRPPGSAAVALSFVGAYGARVDRRIVLEAVRAGFDPLIWGPGWKGVVPDHLLQGERLSQTELAQLYARSAVVLNSHMDDMARFGFMSNRTFDALASGAMVLSDHVNGFAASALPGFRMLDPGQGVGDILRTVLDEAPRCPADRQAIADQIAAHHSMDRRAAIILQEAARVLRLGLRPRPILQPRPGPPAPPPVLSDPAASADTTSRAMRRAAGEIGAIAEFLTTAPRTQTLAPPAAQREQGVIHPLMADLRALQSIACAPRSGDQSARIAALAARARRVSEVLSEQTLPSGFNPDAALADQLMVRVMHNQPLWTHAPEGFDRARGRDHVRLWPKRQPSGRRMAVGVFLHLFHDDLAPAFAGRLQHIGPDHRLHVSTDSDQKAARIRKALPHAEIRVLENRGRDIWPKLYGWADVQAGYDLVLHLHGKKSSHSARLDDWLCHVLDCLTGSAEEVNRIISFFETIPHLGMVIPVTFQPVLNAAHWGANQDIARELAHRMGMTVDLPPDSGLRFPVGSMFWARPRAIGPLLDLKLSARHFPEERGQVDGTLAHAIERMLGVTCRTTGHHILPVSGLACRAYHRHGQTFSSNGALRDALAQGAFRD